MTDEKPAFTGDVNSPSGLRRELTSVGAFFARLLLPPRFNSDPEMTIRGEILMFWILIVFVGYGFISISMFRRLPFALALEFCATPLGGGVAAFTFLKLKKVRLSSITLCGSSIVGLMFSTYHAGGLTAPGIYALIIPMVIAGFTLDRLSMLVLYLSASIYIICVAALEMTGRLPAPTFIQPIPNRAFAILIVTGAVGAMVAWATQRIDRGRKQLEMEVDERRTMEKEVRLLNLELEDRVRDRTADLDAFTTMVAHDLRAPVLHIRGYADLLQQKGDLLDEEAKFFVARLANSSKNMGELIENLLEFSRKQRDGLKRAEINMKELVETVRYEYVESGTIDPAWIEVLSIPAAEGDLALIRQVWTNLLDNAVKYSRHRTDPRIRVYSENLNGAVWYVIEDNGMGFDSQDRFRIFEDFHRSQTSSDIPGTGIGLATVKRIIERHGGRIVAQGELDDGARFSFTLPTSASVALGAGNGLGSGVNGI